ncbi:GreA/GreB family elongation factor [Ectothiorhodospiraceae bacterium WFHF3C12]|nr:GreA/GreB family elongation factor [Ectothiorhodospiraceae bacterium WFHF3C12]
MRTCNFVLSSNDLQKLVPLLAYTEKTTGGFYEPHLAALSTKLSMCRETGPVDVPADVVTMNSHMRLYDLMRRRVSDCALVYPCQEKSSLIQGSVLTPLGANLLGVRAGDAVRFRVDGKLMQVQVQELLFQPEAAGRFDL